LDSFLKAQSHDDTKAYIFEQIPLLSKNPLRSIRFHALGLTAKIDIDPAYQQANATLRSIAVQHTGVSSLNFEKTGLFAQAPFVGRIPIYLDENHLNEEGAKHYAAVSRRAFTTILEATR
jgi:hypothetical protein